ncbi:MAG: translation termination inhibitor protein itt1, partial [Watsoniomyces obsoletus]
MDDDALEDERTIELSSIQAIFPELAIDPSDPYTATLDLPVTPLKPLRIQFSQPTAENAPSQLLTPPTSESQDGAETVKVPTREGRAEIETHELDCLPPLKLRVHLHEGYPAKKPPK